ncbi:MAG TPA: hypothetical protein VFA17_03485 [Thermoplasmata archaeon]|jgi:hypothetical protein|nr:hypothetical protein [Thermoplasmata archaeon]
MAGVRGVSGAGRGLLVVGAAALLASLLVPSLTWFTVSGTKTELPAGTYTGIQTAQLLSGLAPAPYTLFGYLAWAAYALLFVAVTAALAVAGMGRRTRNVGTASILLLLLEGALLYVTAYGLSLPASGAPAVLSVGYGFVAAVAGAALIEAGGRIPGRVPMAVGMPATTMNQENP